MTHSSSISRSLYLSFSLSDLPDHATSGRRRLICNPSTFIDRCFGQPSWIRWAKPNEMSAFLTGETDPVVPVALHQAEPVPVVSAPYPKIRGIRDSTDKGLSV